MRAASTMMEGLVLSDPELDISYQLSLITQPAKSGDVVCSALAPGQKAVRQPGLTGMC